MGKHVFGGEWTQEIAEAWIEEAERRYQEFKKGKIRGIPGDKVFSDIRRELEWQK
ncbi:MAG: addiction module protein [bacterium]|nr:addiction module protein [bacterium]